MGQPRIYVYMPNIDHTHVTIVTSFAIFLYPIVFNKHYHFLNYYGLNIGRYAYDWMNTENNAI